MTEWIPIESKMPEIQRTVLVWLYGDYHLGYLDKDPDNLQLRWNFEEFDLYGDEMEHVEAWIPLPKPYEGK